MPLKNSICSHFTNICGTCKILTNGKEVKILVNFMGYPMTGKIVTPLILIWKLFYLKMTYT